MLLKVICIETWFLQVIVETNEILYRPVGDDPRDFFYKLDLFLHTLAHSNAYE